MTSLDADLSLASDLAREMTSWIQQEDLLVGTIPAPAGGDDIRDSWRAASGRAVAIARTSQVPLDSELSLWSASTCDVAQLRFSRDASAADIAAILDSWLALPDTETRELGGDYARNVRLPVAARRAVLPLVERGFSPATTTLVRQIRATDSEPASLPSGITLREARPEDREAMYTLMQELIDTEVEFAAVRSRTARLGNPYVDEALEVGDGWSVVAEHAGEVIGWFSMSPQDKSAWAQASVSISPITYLGIASVSAARRSAGIGKALSSAIHARAAESGAAYTVLDASVLNSWSMPFWQRCGYRPLWTTWQRR